MQLFNRFSLSESSLLPVPPLEKPLTPERTQHAKATTAKLSIIWVKQFDGECDRLVAHWVKQD
jgi:hypothetical protein